MPEHDIASVRALFRSASAALEAATGSMRDDGSPPDHRLIETLGECSRRFLRLRSEVVGKALALGYPVPPPDRLARLGGLAELMDALSHRERPAELLAEEPPDHPPTEISSPPLLLDSETPRDHPEPPPDWHVTPSPTSEEYQPPDASPWPSGPGRADVHGSEES